MRATSLVTLLCALSVSAFAVLPRQENPWPYCARPCIDKIVGPCINANLDNRAVCYCSAEQQYAVNLCASNACNGVDPSLREYYPQMQEACDELTGQGDDD
ncbi:hypothetical protein BOTBODRAFT_172703 [Botryobasidium botryosum FD-172 SS1]|uniref:Extracellular membrane protein CFEM domain-containing protein n=1 Tax=Botryobasidium botryosum (strain FD-172 SS1) TaxID=930990 RepID=A0A067MYY6_BOTB1|nr:hypothetical protein BOTBODRAFT_172703 [Botryobasidium botryosum FD-172 SS1]